MDQLRFATLVRDLAVDDAAWARDQAATAAAQRRYVILFSARSGSTWLTAVLSATGRLGYPEEYINPDFVAGVAKNLNAKEPERFMQALLRRRKTPNGVFGIEARAVDVELFGLRAFQSAFATDTVFFHLYRENLIAQGISLYRAVETRRYHSTEAAAAGPPPYNAEAIGLWIRHCAATENANVRLLRELGVPAKTLCYEQMVTDRQAIVERFAHALAVPFAPGAFAEAATAPPEKIADAWNSAAETRFRAEHAEMVARFAQERLVKRGHGTSRHAAPPADPALLEAWRAGQRSGAAGRSPRNNRNPAGSALFAAWHAGWQAGWDDQIYLDP